MIARQAGQVEWIRCWPIYIATLLRKSSGIRMRKTWKLIIVISHSGFACHGLWPSLVICTSCVRYPEKAGCHWSVVIGACGALFLRSPGGGGAFAALSFGRRRGRITNIESRITNIESRSGDRLRRWGRNAQCTTLNSQLSTPSRETAVPGNLNWRADRRRPA